MREHKSPGDYRHSLHHTTRLTRHWLGLCSKEDEDWSKGAKGKVSAPAGVWRRSPSHGLTIDKLDNQGKADDKVSSPTCNLLQVNSS